MPTNLKSILEINWTELESKQFTASPQSWQDQILYFLLVDRFSNGQESEATALESADKNSALTSQESAVAWRAAGDTYVGGTLSGLLTKLEYLQNLGITSIWLGPVLKQTAYDTTTYHGYGIQNFLNIDPHFGTLEELQTVIHEAHKRGMYVLMDCIFNHAGNVFTYDLPQEQLVYGKPDFNNIGTYPIVGFCNERGQAVLPTDAKELLSHPGAWPNGAVWPQELLGERAFHRRGCIQEWEDEDQFLNGDFLFLKDFDLGKQTDHGFVASPVLTTLIAAYKYWIAALDIDGYRIDAVKHMPQEATKLFTKEIKQYAAQLGKQNFLCAGEIAGGLARARNTKEATGLDAILAIDDIPGSLERMIKGEEAPEIFFSYAAGQGTHTSAWDPSELIMMYDDHDQIRNGYDKKRFAADEHGTKLAGTALCVLASVAGIPCVYSGSEQALDGMGGDDNYIREALFGGAFGAFRSTGKHVFNTEHPAYIQAAEIFALRKQHSALRTGSQTLLRISGNGTDFGYPQKYAERMKSIVAWMRADATEQLICAFSTDSEQEQFAWIECHGLSATILAQPDAQKATVTCNQDGTAFQLSLPPAGFAIVQIHHE